MNSLRSFAFLLLLVCTVSAYSQKVNYKKLDAYFAQMVTDWDVPGASIGIVKDGQLVFTGNYGTMEVGKKQAPNSETLYAIASNSKAFTSAIIGMLVQEGKLSWDDPVQNHLPYFAVYDDWVSANVTIRDILSHRVGLGTFSGDNIWYQAELSAEEVIKRIRFVPQAYEFRAGYGYSNLMYITAGEIIRAVTGKSWAENVQERILDPLDMDRTIAQLSDLESKGNTATPHSRHNGTNKAIPYANWNRVAATGGLISSVDDVAKWMIFNLNHGIHQGDTLLSPATRNLLWTPHNNYLVDRTKPNDYGSHFRGYGLGWGLSDYHGKLRVSHTGGYDGMITAVTLIPDEDLGIVVLTNGMRSPIMAATYYTIDRFLGRDQKDWSKELLEKRKRSDAADTRVAKRKAARVASTQPTVAVDKILGDYYSDMYGTFTISEKNGELELHFEHTPVLEATLTHWHYDVWEIHWKHPQAWFDFGTIQIRTDAQKKVIGFDFDVPNDDFFFEELKPYKKS